MAISEREFIEMATGRRETLIEFADMVAAQTIEDHQGEPDVASVCASWERANMSRWVDLIFDVAESPIEKSFLAALAIQTFQSFFIVPAPARLDGQGAKGIAEMRSWLSQMIQGEKEWRREHRKKKSRAFYDHVMARCAEEADDMARAFAEFFSMTHIMYAKGGPLADAFHVSVQPKFDKPRIRPDIYIWKPFDPKFKLVVELDGYKYHSSEESFKSDRKRDRTLTADGFQVWRFSGSEIFTKPITSVREMLRFLGWNIPDAN